jgi:uncharacterized protein YabE (DUF348 family)
MECDLKRTARNRLLIVTMFAVLLLAGAAIAFFNAYLESRTVSVALDNDGFKSEIVTMEKTVGNLLDKYGIVLGQGDEVLPDKDELLQDGLTVTIRRAMQILITADGIEHTVYVIEGTVADALKKANIGLSELDETNYQLNASLSPGMVITVLRVLKETIIKKEAIPYQVIVRNDNTQDETQRKVVQQGQQGELQREYKVIYRDGVEVSREFIGEKITQQPVEHIVLAGTLGRKITSRGETVRYAFSRVFEVTAYTHTGNPTRTGVMPKVGHVAVDPRIIPLNSTIFIDFSGRWDHLDGFYKATDTGGVIRGDIVDIFMDTEEEAIRFGRRRARVYLVR